LKIGVDFDLLGFFIWLYAKTTRMMQQPAIHTTPNREARRAIGKLTAIAQVLAGPFPVGY